MINPANVQWVESFLKDLRAATAAAKKLPDSEMAPQVKTMFEGIDPATIGDEVLDQMLGMAGIDDVAGGLPGRMAQINEVLDVLPRPVREKLLTAFFNAMFARPAA